jgi:hypothetical protein
MIGIFEGLTNGYAQGLFLFNNAPSHQNCAPNALSACLMVKGASCFILLIRYAYSPRPLAPKKGGHMATAACACVTVPSPMDDHSLFFTSQNTTLPCQAGSRVWKLLFMNMGCGQKQACVLSARISSAPPTTWIAAAGASYTSSPISLVRSPSLKS